MIVLAGDLNAQVGILSTDELHLDGQRGEASVLIPCSNSGYFVHYSISKSHIFHPTNITTSGAHLDSDTLGDSDPIIERDCQRMWLGGLPPMITEYAVLQLIRQFGNLTDFHFPVHRTGDARGSTVGYCFVAYDTSETAKKALKALNGLKFHGHTLIARPAKPTHDELSLLQRANEEATRLRIMEETKLREAELAARLQKVDGPESTQETDLPILQMKPHKDSPIQVLPNRLVRLARLIILICVENSVALILGARQNNTTVALRCKRMRQDAGCSCRRLNLP
ncbi:unnamed protein product [Dicrocoelium dendriticum]|nr:unnamed protein product [Dicrocoelium dendriticum]